jgi:hypothetical protein
MGLHVNAGATAIQTIRGGTESTLLWACIIGLIMFLPSLIRDFKHMSYIGLLASSTMFVCTILVITGHGVQDFPNGYTPDKPVAFTVWAPEGTTFVQGMNVSVTASRSIFRITDQGHLTMSGSPQHCLHLGRTCADSVVR